jgi:hypothetical protein
LCPVTFLSGTARVGNGGGNNGIKLVRTEFEAVRPKGVGIDNVGACIKIGFVNSNDFFGVRKIPPLGHLPRNKTAGLQERSHAAIKVQYMIFEVL